MESKLNEAGELVNLLKKTVSELDDEAELSVLVDRVCDRLKMPMYVRQKTVLDEN